MCRGCSPSAPTWEPHSAWSSDAQTRRRSSPSAAAVPVCRTGRTCPRRPWGAAWTSCSAWLLRTNFSLPPLALSARWADHLARHIPRAAAAGEVEHHGLHLARRHGGEGLLHLRELVEVPTDEAAALHALAVRRRAWASATCASASRSSASTDPRSSSSLRLPFLSLHVPAAPRACSLLGGPRQSVRLRRDGALGQLQRARRLAPHELPLRPLCAATGARCNLRAPSKSAQGTALASAPTWPPWLGFEVEGILEVNDKSGEQSIKSGKSPRTKKWLKDGNGF
jgi:hypothetical protein